MDSTSSHTASSWSERNVLIVHTLMSWPRSKSAAVWRLRVHPCDRSALSLCAVDCPLPHSPQATYCHVKRPQRYMALQDKSVFLPPARDVCLC